MARIGDSFSVQSTTRQMRAIAHLTANQSLDPFGTFLKALPWAKPMTPKSCE
jgi:hypothetical protein